MNTRATLDWRQHPRGEDACPQEVRDQSVTTGELSSHLAQKPRARDLRLRCFKQCSGGRTRTPNDWTRTSSVTDYTTPEGGSEHVTWSRATARLGRRSGLHDELVIVRDGADDK